MPSFAAAPDGPEMRPRLSASAASINSRSLRGSVGTGTAAGTTAIDGRASVRSQDSSTAKTSPVLRITDRSMTFCNSRMLPGQS